MKSYIGTKIIQAEPMTKEAFNSERSGKALAEGTTEGYKVMYEDDYVSWSPKEPFERAYRLVSNGEKLLILSEQ